MYARRARGDLSFKEICNRLASRYEGDFSTPAAAWMNLGQAFQQRNESLLQWSGETISKDVDGRGPLFCEGAGQVGSVPSTNLSGHELINQSFHGFHTEPIDAG